MDILGTFVWIMVIAYALDHYIVEPFLNDILEEESHSEEWYE